MPQDRKFNGEPYRGIPRKRPLRSETFHLRIGPLRVFNKPLDHHTPVAARLRSEFKPVQIPSAYGLLLHLAVFLAGTAANGIIDINDVQPRHGVTRWRCGRTP